NEISLVVGYPFKSSSDATAEIGTAKFAMYTLNDGAWIKNVAEEARLVEAMRKGGDLTVRGTSGRGTQSTDQYSLKGLGQALDMAEQRCTWPHAAVSGADKRSSPSCPALCRASMSFSRWVKTWMAGTSPAMTLNERRWFCHDPGRHRRLGVRALARRVLSE